MDPFSLSGALALGLAHTVEPCEDKVVVSILTVWGARKWSDSIPLVVLYGFGMCAINTVLAIIFIYLGADIIEGSERYLALGAGIIFVLLGTLMLIGGKFPRFIHILHHHGHQHEKGKTCVLDKIETEKNKLERKTMPKHFFDKTRMNVLLLGFVRGLPYCPIEVAVMLWAISTGSILGGATLIFLFGIGTIIGLIPVGLIFGTIAQITHKTRYGKYLSKLANLAIVIVGIILLILTIFGIELHASVVGL